MAPGKTTFLSFAFFIYFVQAEIPSYIHVCKRSTPNMNQCIINSVQALLPKLREGIPELDIPSLEPMIIPQLVFNQGGFKATGHNITIRGTSNFEIKDLKADINKLEYKVWLRFPQMIFDGIYSVNAQILALPIKGQGPIKGSAHDVEGTALIKGHKTPRNGKTIVLFDKIELKLKMKNYSVRLENLFNGDKALGEAVNVALNENKKELMKLIKPRAEETASRVLLDIGNKITAHFDYEELFPSN